MVLSSLWAVPGSAQLTTFSDRLAGSIKLSGSCPPSPVAGDMAPPFDPGRTQRSLRTYGPKNDIFWTVPGSNRLPHPCHGCALPSELTALHCYSIRNGNGAKKYGLERPNIIHKTAFCSLFKYGTHHRNRFYGVFSIRRLI